MEKYRRLTPIDRYQIEALQESGLSVRGIAEIVERSPSSVSRELKRNSNGDSYSAIRATQRTQARRVSIGPRNRINKKMGLQIRELLLERQLSPEQISAYFKRKRTRICARTIYKFIYTDRRLAAGELYLNLRRKHKYLRSHQAVRNYKNVGKRVNQLWIGERPKIVEKRQRIGDFERDSVLGKKGAPILLTIVDRVSRFTRIVKLKSLNAELTHRATVKALRNLTVHTITNDNGAEFAFHKKTAKALKAKIYFNDPYCAWQRGTNENTNGLIRQYFPKGYDFNLATNQEIRRVQNILNSRPRKCLGFKSSLEVEKDKVGCCIE